jgi:DNA-binding Xre family transcriptional regulator
MEKLEQLIDRQLQELRSVREKEIDMKVLDKICERYSDEIGMLIDRLNLIRSQSKLRHKGRRYL